MEFDIGHADCWIRWNDPIFIFILIFTCIWNAGAHWYVGNSNRRKLLSMFSIEIMFLINLIILTNFLTDGIVWCQFAKWPNTKVYIMLEDGYIILLFNIVSSLAGFFIGHWQKNQIKTVNSISLRKIYILELLMPGWGFLFKDFIFPGVLLCMARAVLFYIILKSLLGRQSPPNIIFAALIPHLFVTLTITWRLELLENLRKKWKNKFAS